MGGAEPIGQEVVAPAITRSRSPSAKPSDAQQIQDRLTLEIDAYTKVINARQAALSELKRRRRRLMVQRSVRQLHANPEVQARRMASLRALFKTPEARAALAARAEAARQRKGVSLSKMTPDQFREYRRLIRKMPRADVLKVMGLA